jgi:quercetin dioxygenase-like cupin family protein
MLEARAATQPSLKERFTMEIVPKPPTRKSEGDHFTGDVYIDQLAFGEGDSRIRASIVRFTPGARNAWHSHVNGQTIHVIEGRGRTQARGEEMFEIHAGETIYTPPGEWHWHGAVPDHFMAHLALMEGAGPDQGADAEWGAPVTDEEYHGHTHDYSHSDVQGHSH